MPARARWKTRRASQYSGASSPVTARHHRAARLSAAACRRLLACGGCPLRDLVVLRDLDPVALRRGEHPATRLLLRIDAFEPRLVEARDGVANVLFVVDREVLSTFLIDVREVLARDVLSSGLSQLWHPENSLEVPFHLPTATPAS